jgi:hypothetical protein
MQKANAAAQAAVLPKIPPEFLDQLVKVSMAAEAVEDASGAFKKALIERALGAEMSHHRAMPLAEINRKRPPTTAMARAARLFGAAMARCASRSLDIEASSYRSSSASTSGASPLRRQDHRAE